MTTAQNTDREKVSAWIDEHWKGQRKCPICENSRWSIGEVVGEVQQMHVNRRLLGESLYPLVVVTCAVCGYTLMFNAVVIGLLEGEV